MEHNMKTNPAQWSALLDYLEKHPELVAKKFTGVCAKQVAKKLNSLGNGQKTSYKWQEAFTKWKSKVKSKAQAYICHIKATGGGSPTQTLSEKEERPMTLIGWVVITGDATTELGIAAEKDTYIPSTIIKKVTERDIGKEPPPLAYLHNYAMPCTSSCTNVGAMGVITEMVDKHENVNMLKRKKVKATTKNKKNAAAPQYKMHALTLTEMHRETMDVLQETNVCLRSMAESQRQLCDAIKELVAAQQGLFVVNSEVV